MILAVKPQLEEPDTDLGGKKSPVMPRVEAEPGFKGIGILYAKDCGATVEFRLVYEKHIPQEIKDIVAELFGVGAIEWNVCK